MSDIQNEENSSYSLVLLYKNQKVGIKKFEYKDFAFRIWDLFSDFTLDNNDLTIKVVLYDPQFYMPGEKNYPTKINFSPSNGSINVSPTSNTQSFSTIFTISCDSYVDTNNPLQHQYSYYFKLSDYNQEKLIGIGNTETGRNIIQDFTNSNTLQTILPRSIENEDLVIMVTIQDQLGAYKNDTLVMNIPPIPNDYFIINSIIILDYIDANIININNDYVIQNLCILVQEMYQIDQQLVLDQEAFSDIKIRSYYFLIYLLKEKQFSLSYESQLIQCINLFINDTEFMNQQQNSIENIIQILNQSLEKSQEQLNFLASTNMLYQIDKFTNQRYLEVKRLQASILQSIEYFIESISLNLQSNRILLISDQEYSQYKDTIIELIQKVQNNYNNLSLPNSEKVSYNGQILENNIQKLTNFLINRYDKIFNEQQNDIIDYQQEDTSTENTIYQIGLTKLQQNIYRKDNNFPYQDQNNELQQYSIINTQNNENIIQFGENKSIQHIFKLNLDQDSNNNVQNNQIQQDLTNFVCISQNEKGEWTNDNCQIIKSEQTNTIKCECSKIQPVTTINDKNGLFGIAGQTFSQEGQETLKEFEWYSSVIFYVFCSLLLLYFTLIKLGFKSDKRDKKAQLIQQNLNDQQLQYDAKLNKFQPIQSGRLMSTQGDEQANTKTKQQESEVTLQELNQPKKNRFMKNQRKNKRTMKSFNFNENDNILTEQNNQNNTPSNVNLITLNSLSQRQSQNQLQNQNNKQNPINEDLILSEMIKSDGNFDINSLNQVQQEQNINMEDQQNNQSQQQPLQIEKRKIRTLTKIFYFHELFNVQLLFLPNISRPLRYTAYFYKVFLSMSILALFELELGLQTIFGICLNSLNSVFYFIMVQLLSHKSKIIKLFGIIFYLISFSLAIYTCLVRTAIIEQQNQWRHPENTRSEWADNWGVSLAQSIYIDICGTQFIFSYFKVKLMFRLRHKPELIMKVVKKPVLQGIYMNQDYLKQIQKN